MLEQKNGNIIAKDGLIDNSYFNIVVDSDTKEQALLNSNGISEAIKYANENGISYIKLQQGTYTFDVVNSKIRLMSNIEIDLNGSTLKVLPNSAQVYTLIHIYDVQNVKVKNGFLIGDKEEHQFTEDEQTHEWGHGVRIEHAKNVEISNLDISKMTGDRYIY